MFRYLKVGLAVVLVFVGLKMTLVDLYKVPPQASLLVIAGVLTGSILETGISRRVCELREKGDTNHA